MLFDVLALRVLFPSASWNSRSDTKRWKCHNFRISSSRHFANCRLWQWLFTTVVVAADSHSCSRSRLIQTHFLDVQSQLWLVYCTSLVIHTALIYSYAYSSYECIECLNNNLFLWSWHFVKNCCQILFNNAYFEFS